MIGVYVSEHARQRLAQRYAWLDDAEAVVVAALRERRYAVCVDRSRLGKHRGLSDRDPSMEVTLEAQGRRVRLRVTPTPAGLTVVTALPEKARRYRPSAEERADLDEIPEETVSLRLSRGEHHR